MKQVLNFKSIVAAVLSFFFTFAVQAQERTLDVNVDVDKGGGTMWYTNPIVWVIAAAVFILLLVALMRGNRARD